MSKNFDEIAFFLIHAIKQFCFGFEKMNELADDYADGSAAKAFYMTSAYHYLAILYLIDKGSNPMGGAIYPRLAEYDKTELLDPIRSVMDSDLGKTTFGEVLRVFRNKVIVHPRYCDSDLNRIYEDVDMTDPIIQNRWQDLLTEAYVLTKQLAIQIAVESGQSPSDFGLQEIT